MKHELQMHLAELRSPYLKDKGESGRHLWLIRQSASFDHPASNVDGLSETNLLVRRHILHVSTTAQRQFYARMRIIYPHTLEFLWPDRLSRVIIISAVAYKIKCRHLMCSTVGRLVFKLLCLISHLKRGSL